MRATLCVIALSLLTIAYGTRAAGNSDNRMPQWTPPRPDVIPKGPLGDSIGLGRLIFTQTRNTRVRTSATSSHAAIVTLRPAPLLSPHRWSVCRACSRCLTSAPIA